MTDLEIEKLIKDIKELCPLSGDVDVHSNDKTAVVRFIPNSENITMTDQYEDMIVEGLNHKGYEAENVSGIGFIIKNINILERPILNLDVKVSDFPELLKITEKYLDEIEKGNIIDDMSELSEIVMEMLYGKDIWNYINQKKK